MPRAFADLMFTRAVRAHQKRMGSADSNAGFLDDSPMQGHEIGPAEQAFIQARDGFYQATVSETGWPYVQHRGGPPGFLKVLDKQTLAYADFSGNRQYISRGNLDGNDRVALILMDYANQKRLKLLGRLSFAEGAEAASELAPAGLVAERAALIRVVALDWNCPSHITPKFTEAELRPHLNSLGQDLALLKAENERLRQALKRAGTPDN